MMNILVTASQKYCPYVLTMLKSLFRHNKCDITVYLLYSRIDDGMLDRIRRYIEEHGHTFAPIRVGDDVFDDAPVNMYFTKEMYYRLLASRLLPEDVDRVLYMDPDILIRGSVEEFYHLPFDGNMLIAIPDPPQTFNRNITDNRPHHIRLGLPENLKYVNSGVLLMNLRLMRENHFDVNRIFEIINEKKDGLMYPDQDAINIYFFNSIKHWKNLYNYNPGMAADEVIKWGLSKKFRRKENPIIVHFMGPVKPWSIHYRNKYCFEYQEVYREFAPLKYKIQCLFRPLVAVCGYILTVVCMILHINRPGQ